MVKLYQFIENIFKNLALTTFVVAWPNSALAHCPLCTIGAGTAAGLALWLGISPTSIGLFIGAFAVAVGLWVARIIPKHFKGKLVILVIASFITTILPLTPLIQGYYPLLINWSGDYGSIFNRTYLINLFLVGSIIGGAIMLISPKISGQINRLKGKRLLPFQSIIVTFILLIITSLIFEAF